MKKIILSIVVAVLFVSFSLTTYAGQGPRKIKKDLKVLLMPSRINLVENNGQIDVMFKISVPEKYVHKKHQYIFTPILTDYNNIMPLTSIVINGKSYAKMSMREGHSKKMKEKMKSAPDMSNAITLTATKNARMIDYQYIVPFEPWMQNADLVAVQRFNSKKNTVLIAEDIYGRGVKVTPPPAPTVSDVNTTKVINKMEGKININFLINSSKIDMTLDNNIREFYNLNQIVKHLMDNKNNVIDSIVIIASSSPDGPYQLNKNLSQARAASVKEYLAKNMGLTEQKSDMIKTRYIAENWEGLEDLVMASDVTNKEGILKAISIKDLAQREKAMMALPQYGYIKKNILPLLRFVKYQIFYHTMTTTVVKKVVTPPTTVNQATPMQQQTVYMQQGQMNDKDRVKFVDKTKKRGHRMIDKEKMKQDPHYLRYHR